MNCLPVNYIHFEKRSRCHPTQIRSAWAWRRFQSATPYRWNQGDTEGMTRAALTAAWVCGGPHLKLLTSVSLAPGHGKRTPSRKSGLQKPNVVKEPIKHVIIHLDLMSGRLEVCAAADHCPFMRCNFKKKKKLIFWCTSHRNLLSIMLKGPVAIRPGPTINRNHLSFVPPPFKRSGLIIKIAVIKHLKQLSAKFSFLPARLIWTTFSAWG